MSETLSIVVEKRIAQTPDNRANQADGFILGSLYGHGVDPVAIRVDASEMLRLYRKAGRSKLITLELDGKKVEALVKELTLHPVRHEIQHVDFFAIDEKRPVVVPVPFQFTGTSPAVKNYGGVLTISHNFVRLQCLPKEIPSAVVVDISTTDDIGSTIKLSNVPIDPRFRVRKMDQGAIICTITGRKRVAAVAKVEDKKKKKK